MGIDLGKLGDLTIGITIDSGELDPSLAAAASAVASAATSMSSSFAPLSNQLELITADIGNFGASIGSQLGLFSEWGGAIDVAEANMQRLAAAEGAVATGATEAAGGVAPLANNISQLVPASDGATQSLGSMLAQMAGGILTLAGLKSAVEEMITSFGGLQRATEALGAITHNIDGASASIDRIVRLSDELAVPQQQFLVLTQRLLAFQVQMADVPRTLEAVTQAARTMNTDVQTVGQRFDQIINSGMIMRGVLTNVGLTFDDLAKTMHMVGASNDEVKASFKGIQDEATKASILTEAIFQKTGDLAVKAANDTIGAWQQIGNKITEVFQDVGKQLDGFKGSVGVISVAIGTIGTLFLGLVVIVKGVSDVVIGLGGIILAFLTGVAKAAIDLQNFNFVGVKTDIDEAVAGVKNAFQGMTTDMARDFNDTKAAMDKLWVDGMGTARDQIAKTIPHIALVTKAHKDLTASLIETADVLLTRVPASYEAYVKSLSEGGATAASLLGAVDTEIDKFIAKMNEMGGATPKMLLEFGKLKQAQELLEDFASTDAWNKLAVQIANIAAKYPQQVAELTGATKSFVQSMIDTANALPAVLNKGDTAAMIESELKDLKALDDAWLQLTLHPPQVTKVVNEALLAMQLFTDRGNSDMLAVNKNWMDAATNVTTYMGKVAVVTKAMDALGVSTSKALQEQVDAWAKAAQFAQEQGAALNIILGFQAKSIEAQIKLNALYGASGDETLAWTMKLQGVKVQQQAIYDQTMGLSNLYTGMVSAFGKAWDEVGKGLADAIVSGQNFGQVFGNVMDTLKKQLAELVVGYLQTQLKDAILENTDLLKNFNTIFTSIFGGDGFVSKGIGELDKNIATMGDTLTSSAKTASDSITATTKSATDGIQSVSKSMMDNILPAIQAIAAVIGAIAGIIGDIEMAHMEKTLGQIETNTRRIDIGTNNPGGVIDTLVHVIAPYLDNIYGAAIGIWGEVGNVTSNTSFIGDRVSGIEGWLMTMSAQLDQLIVLFGGISGGTSTGVRLDLLANVVQKGFADLSSSIGSDFSILIIVLNGWFDKLINTLAHMGSQSGIGGSGIGGSKYDINIQVTVGDPKAAAAQIVNILSQAGLRTA